MKLRHRATTVALFVVVAAGASGANAQERQVPPSMTAVRYSFAPIVKMVTPAVVTLYVTRDVTRPQGGVSPADPVARRYFTDPSYTPKGIVGAGVILDPAGIIVTNSHVISEANRIRVVLADGREFDGEPMMRDPSTDTAVVRIRADTPLPALELADSDAAEVGDLVLAVGNPFGVGQTVTSGIISGLARTQIGSYEHQFFIQTDAAINPGNSGGALVDAGGRLVGVNTAIYSRTGGSNGIGFAVPSNMIRVIVDAAKNGQPVRRPWLGATLQPVTAETARQIGLTDARGAIVAAVVDGGPAAAAGIQPGDVIKAVDGVPIEDPDVLAYRMTIKGFDRGNTLAVVRSGRETPIRVAAVITPDPGVPRETIIDGLSPFAGATIADLSPDVMRQRIRDGLSQGVLVTRVADGSRAQQLGLKQGDIVLDVNGVLMDSRERFVAVTSEASKLWQYRLDRQGRIVRSVFGG